MIFATPELSAGGTYAEGRFCTLRRFVLLHSRRSCSSAREACSAWVREADKQVNAPVEAPAPVKRKSVDPARLREEAEELAKLSATIPAQVDQVNKGQIPKDLGDQLKRIEKLAKHLRSEIIP
jgi:hypothetical protein